MKNVLYRILSFILMRDIGYPTKKSILRDLEASKPLPLGRQEFLDWSDRIIKASLLQADEESMRFTLSGLLLQLGPTEDHKPDAYFVKALRKAAVAQVGVSMIEELQATRRDRRAAEAAKLAAQQPDPTPVLAVVPDESDSKASS